MQLCGFDIVAPAFETGPYANSGTGPCLPSVPMQGFEPRTFSLSEKRANQTAPHEQVCSGWDYTFT